MPEPASPAPIDTRSRTERRLIRHIAFQHRLGIIDFRYVAMRRPLGAILHRDAWSEAHFQHEGVRLDGEQADGLAHCSLGMAYHSTADDLT